MTNSGHKFFCLWFHVRLIYVGKFFDIGKFIKFERVLGIKWMVVKCSECKVGVVCGPKIKEDESVHSLCSIIVERETYMRTLYFFRSGCPRVGRCRLT